MYVKPTMTWDIYMFYKGNQNYGGLWQRLKTIKKIRLALCMSQKWISRALKWQLLLYPVYERGLRKPSFATIRKMIAISKKHNIKINLEDIRPE